MRIACKAEFTWVLSTSLMTAKEFRIGFFGKGQKGCSLSVGDYEQLKSLVIQSYNHTDRLIVYTSLHTHFEITVARHILALRKGELPNLRLEIVTDRCQLRNFYRSQVTGKPLAYTDIMREANDFIPLESDFPSLKYLKVVRFFIEHCDLLVHGVLPQGMLRFMEERIACGALKTISLSDIRQERIPESYYLERLLEESVRYIRDNHFQISAADIPLRLLAAWSTRHPARMRRYCLSFPYEWADILQLKDPQAVFLPLKVFTYAYAWAHDCWMIRCGDCPEEVFGYFVQFQKLVHYSLNMRQRGRHIPDFNLFGFENYNELLDKLPDHERDIRQSGRQSPGNNRRDESTGSPG